MVQFCILMNSLKSLLFVEGKALSRPGDDNFRAILPSSQ